MVLHPIHYHRATEKSIILVNYESQMIICNCKSYPPNELKNEKRVNSYIKKQFMKSFVFQKNEHDTL